MACRMEDLRRLREGTVHVDGRDLYDGVARKTDAVGAVSGATPHILLIDDEDALLRSLTRALRNADFRLSTAQTGARGLDIADADPVDVAFIDMRMPGLTGLDVLRELKSRSPATEVILMTGFGTVETAVEAMREGAFDFITKPFEHPDVIRFAAERALERRELRQTNRRLTDSLKDRYHLDNLIGGAPAMLELFRQVRALARNESPVLIEGESGTGKELLAHAIHMHSPRREQPFVAVDCGALAETVVESELFGHVKGAFTGAISNTPGLIRAANMGTLFLDEIGELSPQIQAKLLRVLQDWQVRPVGSTTPVKVNVRLITATNRNLAEEVSEGRFRQDLYYRLNVIPFHLPRLAERREDIALLFAHFIAKHDSRFDGAIEVDGEVIEVLQGHDWPGNVRELENCVEQTVALLSEPRITVRDLPSMLRGVTRAPASVASVESGAADADDLSFEAYERMAIERALADAHGDVPRAAAVLGVGKSTLYRKMKQLGINPRTGRAGRGPGNGLETPAEASSL